MAASAWKRAESELLKALAKRSQSGLNVEEYGLKFVDYLPHYWLGVTYFNLGDFDKAALRFEQEKIKGVIQKSSLFENLQQYEQTLARLQQLRQTGASMKAQQELSLQQREQLQEFERALQRRDFAAAQTLLATLESASIEPALWTSLKTAFGQLLAVETQRKTSSETALDEKFQNGLEQYVAGNYAAALRAFAEVEAERPAFRQVSNWRKQTEWVMATLKIKPDTVAITKVDTIRSTAAPLFAFTSPIAVRTETRADSIQIAGSASDDHGIKALRFTLNGLAYTDASGAPIALAPANASEALNFSFQIMLPLRLGENQIIVTAYDTDPEPHHSTFPKTVMRLRPWHQTPAFYLAASVVLLLSVGSALANTLIKRRIAFVNRYNPYIAGAPVRNEKMFFGREKLLERVINTLPNNSLMMHGPRRIGKTSLQHQLKKRLESNENPEYHYVPVFIDLQGVREERFFLSIMEDVAEAVAPHSALKLRNAGRATEYSVREFSADVKEALTQLQAQTAKKLKLVLLLDEVDTLNSYSARMNQQLRSIFMKSFAENLVAVMSGSYIRKHWESEGSPWYNFFEEIEVPPLERAEALALIAEPVQGIFSYEKAALEKILTYSMCQPYRIQRLCVNVINRIIAMKRRRVTAEDVEAVRAEIFEQETR